MICSFKDIKGADGRTFQWNPCTPFKVKECRDTMVSDEKEAEMNLYYFHSNFWGKYFAIRFLLESQKKFLWTSKKIAKIY